jgi:hypothetical protein
MTIDQRMLTVQNEWGQRGHLTYQTPFVLSREEYDEFLVYLRERSRWTSFFDGGPPCFNGSLVYCSDDLINLKS